MVYYFWKYFFLTFLYLFCGWRVNGLENLPPSGPVLVVSNHRSYWDPIVVGAALSRKVHFMAKKELFSIPVLGWMIPRIGAFPVSRGVVDRQAVKVALRLLQQGKVVGVFPEGTRNKQGGLLPFQTGAAALAIRTNAPILPVAVKGTENPLRWLRFKPVTVQIGAVIEVQGVSDPAAFTRTLEQQISRMLA